MSSSFCYEVTNHRILTRPTRKGHATGLMKPTIEKSTKRRESRGSCSIVGSSIDEERRKVISSILNRTGPQKTVKLNASEVGHIVMAELLGEITMRKATTVLCRSSRTVYRYRNSAETFRPAKYSLEYINLAQGKRKYPPEKVLVQRKIASQRKLLESRTDVLYSSFPFGPSEDSIDRRIVTISAQNGLLLLADAIEMNARQMRMSSK